MGFKRCGSRSALHWMVLLEEGMREGLDRYRSHWINSLPRESVCSTAERCRILSYLPHPTSAMAENVWLVYKKALMREEAGIGCLDEGQAPPQGRASLRASLTIASRWLHEGMVATHI